MRKPLQAIVRATALPAQTDHRKSLLLLFFLGIPAKFLPGRQGFFANSNRLTRDLVDEFRRIGVFRWDFRNFFGKRIVSQEQAIRPDC
jgi:hypothetical protein